MNNDQRACLDGLVSGSPYVEKLRGLGLGALERVKKKVRRHVEKDLEQLDPCSPDGARRVAALIRQFIHLEVWYQTVAEIFEQNQQVWLEQITEILEDAEAARKVLSAASGGLCRPRQLEDCDEASAGASCCAAIRDQTIAAIFERNKQEWRRRAFERLGNEDDADDVYQIAVRKVLQALESRDLYDLDRRATGYCWTAVDTAITDLHRRKGWFKLTQKDIEDLRCQDVPGPILDKLRGLVGEKGVGTRDGFLKQLTSVGLDAQELKLYGELILQQARGRNPVDKAVPIIPGDEGDPSAGEPADSHAPPDLALQNEEVRDALRFAIKQLRLEYRNALGDQMAEKTIEQAAAERSLPPGTVGIYRFRAKKELRDRLAHVCLTDEELGHLLSENVLGQNLELPEAMALLYDMNAYADKDMCLPRDVEMVFVGGAGI